MAVKLSEGVETVVREERQVVFQRHAGLLEQSQRLHELIERVDAELAETASVLRRMDDLLGLAPQLSIEALDGELRGRQLQEVAVRVLRERRPIGEEIHYRDWYGLLVELGLRIAGRDPVGTFLTQIARAQGVESVRPRSGLYRLTA
ncbi:MAG: hypothetical protein QOH16_3880 [Gaiellaceae bacterium]|nr:hypothetical protein [Gaiellaceae bacterium]